MDKKLENKIIGVLMGGVSSEREISINSGTSVYNCLKEEGYDVHLVDANSDICNKLSDLNIDIAFIALHGGWGENGSIQGMLEVTGLQYTGSGVLASAIAMDKVISKIVFRNAGLRISPYIVINKESFGKNKSFQSLPSFPLPWVVKPASEGSSVGVSIIKKEEELSDVAEKAFSYGKRIIIEGFIRGKETHIGILGDEVLGGVEVRPKKEFYNYEAKYTRGLTDYILPPEIDEDVYKNIQEEAYSAYSAIGCKGACRVDFIISDKGEAFLLEVNTLPGMTDISLLPKVASLSGYTYLSLIEAILIDAL